MANNRYYLLCPCGATQYIGKSLADGIYVGGPPGYADGYLDKIHAWLWEHLMQNHAGNTVDLTPEWVATDPASGGKSLFQVITEYDDRAPGGYAPKSPSSAKET